MSHAGPARSRPDVSPRSLWAWYDEHRISDSALYDITAQAATSLSGLLVQKQLAATDVRERGHWAARARLVSRQQAALDPSDRVGLIAQQQAWLEEADALTREPPALSPVSDQAAEVGSDQWLQGVFDIAARDAIFPSAPPELAAGAAPLLVLLGGPPASGKTRAHRAILARYPRLVPITGDELRAYDPDYDRLLTTDPLRMPNATMKVSGGLVRLALSHALQCRYSVLLEGVFRDPAMVTGTAERFAEAGYTVGVVAVATPAPLSRLSAEQRFLGAPSPRAARWTPYTAHESALQRSPDVVGALEACRAVSWVQLSTRTRTIYDNARTPERNWRDLPAAARLLRQEQTRALTQGEALGWLADYEALFALACDRTGYLNPVTLPAYRLLQSDAERLMRSIGPHPDITRFRGQHRQRAAALEAVRGLDPVTLQPLDFPQASPFPRNGPSAGQPALPRAIRPEPADSGRPRPRKGR